MLDHEIHQTAILAAQAYAEMAKMDSACNCNVVEPALFGANVAKAYKAAYDGLKEQPSEVTKPMTGAR